MTLSRFGRNTRVRGTPMQGNAGVADARDLEEAAWGIRNIQRRDREKKIDQRERSRPVTLSTSLNDWLKKEV